MKGVEVVVAHDERATLRIGDVFLKIDADRTRTDIEVEAMAIAGLRVRRAENPDVTPPEPDGHECGSAPSSGPFPSASSSGQEGVALLYIGGAP